MSVVASDGPEIFLHAYVCFYDGTGFYCGSEWQHNAHDDDDVEYKHDFTFSLNTANPIEEHQKNFQYLLKNPLAFKTLFLLIHNFCTCLSEQITKQRVSSCSYFSYKIKRKNSLCEFI